MCKHLVSLVYKKRVGSAARKAVLGYMADRASEDGDGIYTSKGRIARETEFSESAVKRAIKEFLAEGIAVEVGERRHQNGKTTVYALVKSQIEALPDASENTTSSATQSTVDPVQGEPRPSGTPTPFRENPHPVQGEPQTTKNHLEPQRGETPRDILCQVLSEEVADAYLDHRKGKRAKITANAARILVKKLKGHPAPDAVVEESIANGWTGVFPEKSRASQQYGPRQSQAQSWTAGAQIPSDIFKDTPPPARNN